MVQNHEELKVYQKAFDAAMIVFKASKEWPVEERYSLTDQMRRSSRSVCANLAEGWRKRIYEKAFVAKISDAEAEAAETQVWIHFAVECGYLSADVARPIYEEYAAIIGTLVGMRTHAKKWILTP